MARKFERLEEELKSFYPDARNVCVAAVYLFSKLIHEKSTRFLEAPSRDTADSLSYSELIDSDFKPYTDRFSDDFSLLDYLVDIGLLTKAPVLQTDLFGYQTEGAAFSFFHDRLAEYCLSHVFAREILGQVNSAEFRKRDESSREALLQKIQERIDFASDFTIGWGALKHWFYQNMAGDSDVPKDFLVPLWNQLSDLERGSVNSFILDFFQSLIVEGIVDAERFLGRLCQEGNQRLKLLVVALIDQLGDAYHPLYFHNEILRHLSEEDDDDVFREMGDILVEHYRRNPEGTFRLIEANLMGANATWELLRNLMTQDRFKKHLTLMTKLGSKFTLLWYSHPEAMMRLRDFLSQKFKLIVESLIAEEDELSPHNIIKNQIRATLFNKIERNGVNNR